jgi:NADPH:quinone reductase-like Zn-dependent oxidoreductase
VPFVDEDAVCEPSSADDPEDPVIGGKSSGSRPAGDDRAGYLDPRDVGWRSGRSGIAALALCDVSGVQPGVADSDKDVVSTRDGIGSADEIDDLISTRAVEDDCQHAVSVCDGTAAGSVRSRLPPLGGRRRYGSSPGGHALLAAVCVRISPDDPLAGLEIREVPEPTPPDGWEVVEVRAAAINHHDLFSLRGIGIAEDDLPVILGTDAAGVTADGREVVVYAVLGDPEQGEDEMLGPDFHVFSERGVPGTLAERMAVPTRNLVPLPAGFSFAQAACLPVAYLTAYRMLFTRADLKPGQSVLVQGAGGGVSTAALLLGKAAGLEVYVTSRSEDRRARALELGAAGAFAPGSRLPHRVDAVLDSVGKATWEHSLKSLRPGGTVVVAGATSGADPSADLARMFWRQLTVRGSSMGTRGEFRDLCTFLEQTGVRPLIDSEFALADTRAALARLHEGGEFGKIVVIPPLQK